MATHMVGDPHAFVKRLDAIGWGLFFIWIGIALSAQLGWGPSLLGIGIIVLGGQMARLRFDIPVERFWVIVGMLLAFYGAWESLADKLGGAPLPGGLVPILFIVVGIVLIASAWQRME